MTNPQQVKNGATKSSITNGKFLDSTIKLTFLQLLLLPGEELAVDDNIVVDTIEHLALICQLMN